MTNLYAIRTHGAPFVKIGTARDPAKRLAELQTGSPFKLFIYATRGGASLAEEFALHRKLHHLRSTNEWFRWEGEVVDVVKLWPRFESGHASKKALQFKEDIEFEESEKTRLRKRIEELEEKVESLRMVDRNANNLLDTVQTGLRAIGERFGINRRNNAFRPEVTLAQALDKLPREELVEALLGNHLAVDIAVDCVRQRLNKAASWPLQFPLGVSGDWVGADRLLGEVAEVMGHKYPRLRMKSYEERNPALREAVNQLSKEAA